jgi:hypothetical protein
MGCGRKKHTWLNRECVEDRRTIGLHRIVTESRRSEKRGQVCQVLEEIRHGVKYLSIGEVRVGGWERKFLEVESGEQRDSGAEGLAVS